MYFFFIEINIVLKEDPRGKIGLSEKKKREGKFTERIQKKKERNKEGKKEKQKYKQ